MRFNKGLLLEFIFALFLLFLLFITRSIEVLNHNYIFGFDQGRDYLAVRDIVVNHKPTLIGAEIGAGSAGFKGIFHGPFYYYSLAVPFALTGGDPYSGIVLMFLFGAFSIFFAYYFGRRLLGILGGAAIAIFIAICPQLTSQSRFVWNSHASTVFILLAFYFVYLSFKKDNKYIFLATFFSGFIYNFELAISVPLSVALLIYYLFILKLKKIEQYIFLFLGYLLAFSPMFLFELRHNFLGSGGIWEYIFNSKQKTTPTSLNLIDHFNSFSFHFSDTFMRQSLIPTMLLFLIIISSTFYLLFKEKNRQTKSFIFFLLLLIPVNFVIFSFLRNSVYVYYLIDLTLVYIFLFSYSFSSFCKNKNYFLSGIFALFILFLLTFSIPNFIKTFKFDYSDYGGDAKIKGKIDAIDYIYKDAKGNKFGLLVFSPPVYTYPYDYVILWYAKEKYHYIPYNEKKGLFYLLIEKDPAKPYSYKGWLETVIKEGKVLEQKQLPNGFIVEKRFL